MRQGCPSRRSPSLAAGRWRALELSATFDTYRMIEDAPYPQEPRQGGHEENSSPSVSARGSHNPYLCSILCTP